MLADARFGEFRLESSREEVRPRFDERRDLTARAIRDKLAERLDVHPSELGSLSADTCTRVLANLNLANERMHQLEEAAAIDELTGVLRRGHGMLTLTREVRRAFREDDPRLAVAFIDVDGLKRVNDTRGHAEGDRLLIAVAQALTRRLRSHDVVYRYGGDEFVCVLPGANLDGAQPIFESLHESFLGDFENTFSIGLAELQEGDTPETLLARADTALYASRRLRDFDSGGGGATELAGA
jgi:diguanylate cyclase (GGDEF)-like protein